MPPPSKSKRHFERGTPQDALTWNTARQRWARLLGWQVAVSTKFAGSARIVRVAWLLSWLCQKEGYAFPTDGYISKTLGIPLNKVQQALTELQRAGAIVRASSFVDGKARRRIWPSTKIIPPTAGGMDTPRDDRVDTPRGGGTDSIERPRSRKTGRISSTAEAAKRDAERREQREQQRHGTASGDDSQNTLSDERRAPQAPPRLADAVIESEIIVNSGVAEAPPPPNHPYIDQSGNPVPPPPDRRRPPPRVKSNVERGREMLRECGQ
jgi:hypothetical protein